MPLSEVLSEAHPGTDDVFLMNTFTDAQLIVSRDVASLLDRLERGVESGFDDEERRAGQQRAQGRVGVSAAGSADPAHEPAAAGRLSAPVTFARQAAGVLC